MRSFRLIDSDNVSKGRYSGLKPQQAANKAFSEILKNCKNKKEEKIFSMKDTKSGKVYSYSGKRVELSEPVTIPTAKNGNITYKYSTTITKCKNPQLDNLKNKKSESNDKEDKPTRMRIVECISLDDYMHNPTGKVKLDTTRLEL